MRWRWRAESRSPPATRAGPTAIRSRRGWPSRSAAAGRLDLRRIRPARRRRTRPAGPPRSAQAAAPAGTTSCRHPATFASGGPSAAETTATAGQKCQWGEAVWNHGRRVAGNRHRPARRVLAGYAGVVRGCVRGADTGPGGRVAGDRQGRGHAGRRADRFGQDAGRVLVGARQAGGGAAARGPEAAHPGALRLPAQGAGGGHRAEPARSADRDPARRAPARPGRAGRQGGGAHRRHRCRGAQEAGRQAAGHPHHHPGITFPRAHLAGQGDPARGRDGHRRRGARRRGQQARRPPGAVPRASRRAARGSIPRPAGGAFRDRAAGRGGGHVPRRHPRGHRGAPAQPQAHRTAGRRPGGGHDRAGHDAGPRRRRRRGRARAQALDLAARRGTGARPDRAAQVHDRVRELAAAGRAAVRPAERAGRRAGRSRRGGQPEPGGDPTPGRDAS